MNGPAFVGMFMLPLAIGIAPSLLTGFMPRKLIVVVPRRPTTQEIHDAWNEVGDAVDTVWA